MSTVIGVRVSKEIKEELERLGIDYAEEVRKNLEELIKRRKMEQTVKDLRRFRASMREVKGNIAAEIIREERERH